MGWFGRKKEAAAMQMTEGQESVLLSGIGMH